MGRFSQDFRPNAASLCAAFLIRTYTFRKFSASFNHAQSREMKFP